MNQISPLHIGAFLIALLAFTFFQLSNLQEELVDASDSYAESEKLAVELSSLKEVYASKSKTKKAIDRVLNQSTLRSTDLDIKRTKSSISIASKSIDAKALNSLMGKILNASYNITRLKIKKLSETKASLDMEIKW
ncbi:hypothetical protein GJV85_00735 [Sulfurimonas aquatica]|uniref:Uncharacterized protein n=1 Tax=Sulfurimonas aquatica TaxID=2672570 RepID=A0A975GBY0_9BACT|nr:hypothetical protein [Sulfurimonas aquatica]QSZ40703.1 hypothetical protein GJV85_00735 [Sulfurimonas aquatica]